MDLTPIHVPLIIALCNPCADAEAKLKSEQQDVQLLIRPASIEGKRYSLVTFSVQNNHEYS